MILIYPDFKDFSTLWWWWIKSIDIEYQVCCNNGFCRMDTRAILCRYNSSILHFLSVSLILKSMIVISWLQRFLYIIMIWINWSVATVDFVECTHVQFYLDLIPAYCICYLLQILLKSMILICISWFKDFSTTLLNGDE